MSLDFGEGVVHGHGQFSCTVDGCRCAEERKEEVSNPTAISQRRMQLAGAVEDIVDAHLFAFIGVLKRRGYLTEQNAHECLDEFYESLQTPGT